MLAPFRKAQYLVTVLRRFLNLENKMIIYIGFIFLYNYLLQEMQGSKYQPKSECESEAKAKFFLNFFAKRKRSEFSFPVRNESEAKISKKCECEVITQATPE